MSNDTKKTPALENTEEKIVITIDKKKLKKIAIIGATVLTGAFAVSSLLKLNEKMEDENLPHLQVDADFVNPADETTTED